MVGYNSSFSSVLLALVELWMHEWTRTRVSHECRVQRSTTHLDSLYPEFGAASLCLSPSWNFFLFFFFFLEFLLPLSSNYYYLKFCPLIIRGSKPFFFPNRNIFFLLSWKLMRWYAWITFFSLEGWPYSNPSWFLKGVENRVKTTCFSKNSCGSTKKETAFL